jgi:hypothetical protein
VRTRVAKRKTSGSSHAHVLLGGARAWLYSITSSIYDDCTFDVYLSFINALAVRGVRGGPAGTGPGTGREVRLRGHDTPARRARTALGRSAQRAGARSEGRNSEAGRRGEASLSLASARRLSGDSEVVTGAVRLARSWRGAGRRHRHRAPTHRSPARRDESPRPDPADGGLALARVYTSVYCAVLCICEQASGLTPRGRDGRRGSRQVLLLRFMRRAGGRPGAPGADLRRDLNPDTTKLKRKRSDDDEPYCWSGECCVSVI